MDRNSELRQAVLDSGLRDFPILGQQLGQAIHPLQGSGLALVVGIVGLVWGGLGVTQVGQLAMAEVWNVPGVHRPPFVKRLLRGSACSACCSWGWWRPPLSPPSRP